METRKRKKCSKCKELKPLIEFGKNKSMKDGLQHYCNKCRSIGKMKNREKIIRALWNKELTTSQLSEITGIMRKNVYTQNLKGMVNEGLVIYRTEQDGVKRIHYASIPENKKTFETKCKHCGVILGYKMKVFNEIPKRVIIECEKCYLRTELSKNWLELQILRLLKKPKKTKDNIPKNDIPKDNTKIELIRNIIRDSEKLERLIKKDDK